MTKKFKRVLWCLGGLLLLLLVAGLFALMFIDNIIKGAVQGLGSQVTKCQVTVEKVNLSYFQGHLLIENLVMGNPDTYKTDNAFSVSKVYVSLEPMSLLTGQVVITEINIHNPEITYELGIGNSNIGTILDNVNRFIPAKDPNKPKKKEKSDSASGKAVRIDHVLVEGGKINLSAKLLMGSSLPIPLPKVEIRDIGKTEGEPVLAPEATAIILKEMLTGVIKEASAAATAILDSGKKLLEGSQDAGDAVLDSGKKLLESGKELGRGLRSLIPGKKDTKAPASEEKAAE